VEVYDATTTLTHLSNCPTNFASACGGGGGGGGGGKWNRIS
jgi:hypothetical protein